MGFFNNFPYTNFHELNLDWLVRELKKVFNRTVDNAGKISSLEKRVEDVENTDIDGVVRDETNKILKNYAESGIFDAILENSVKYAKRNIPDFSKVLIIGDSYSKDWSSDHDFPGFVQELMNLAKCENFTRFCFGGDGFVATSGSGRNFYQSLVEVVYPQTQNEAKDYTLIIVQGGGNDHKQSLTDEYNGAKLLLDGLRRRYVNAEIWGVVGYWPCAMYQDTVGGIVKAFTECGVPYTANFTTMLNQMDLFLPDELHPNSKGCKYMANSIYAAMQGCNPITKTMGFVSLSGGGCVWSIDGNNVVLDIVCAGQFNGGNTVEVGELPIRLRPADRDRVFADVFSNIGASCYLLIERNGKIKIYYPATTSQNVSLNGTISYPLFGAENNQKFNF